MEKVINELLKFSDEILNLNSPIEDDRINIFENKFKIILPNDFKKFISKINGFTLMGNNVYGFDENLNESIEKVYQFEHFEVNFPQYDYLVPFCNDGRGNFYCLDTSKNNNDETCPIIFWVSNYEYSTEDTPEIVNNSFIEWINEVIIDWTLESYNYDGSDK